MKISWVPIKNFLFQNEIDFLEKKFEEGLKLRKRGVFFYYFERTEPKKVICEIELSERKFDANKSDCWNLLCQKKTFYKKLVKNYYYSEAVSARLLVNEDLRFPYYKYYQQLFMLLSGVTIFPALFTFVLATASIELPKTVYYVSCLLILPFIYFIRSNANCEKIVLEMSTAKGILTGFEANYILRFKDLSETQKKDIEENLNFFGYVRKIDDEYYRLQSPLKKEELFEEIVGMTLIDRAQLTLTNIGDFYVMT